MSAGASRPPVGGEEANEVVSEWGETPDIGFEPRPHWELGERLGILDLAAGSRISGSGFPVMRGAGARLQRGLINFFLDVHTAEHGYTEQLSRDRVLAFSATEGTSLFRVALRQPSGHLLAGVHPGATAVRALVEPPRPLAMGRSRPAVDPFGTPTPAVPVAPLDLPPGAAGTRWIDGLQPDGAEVLAGYRHPHFGQWAAVTTTAPARSARSAKSISSLCDTTITRGWCRQSLSPRNTSNPSPLRNCRSSRTKSGSSFSMAASADPGDSAKPHETNPV